MKFVSLVAIALTGAALFADEPLLKFGVLSDIHITADGDGSNVSINSTDMFRKALGYFGAQKADAVVVAGDLANDGRVAELQIVGKLWDEVFPNGKGSDGRPVEKVFIYGNHDPNRWPSRNTHGEKLIIDDPAGAWEQAFHESYKPVYVKSVKGYDFVCAHWGQEGRAVAQIESVGKSGRPFFHVQHPNMLGTVHGGKVGQDCGAVFSVLSKFPQAVSFSGHSHLPLENEQAIWQGAFTAVNTAALRYIAISGYRSSQFPRSYENGMVKKHSNADADGPKVMYCEHYHTDLHEGLLVSVYSDRIVLSRREFGADVPIGTDWVVPLDGTRPYDLETRRKAAVPPEFPAGAKLTVSRVQAKPIGGKKGEKVDAWELRFPAAKGAYEYEITGTGPDGMPVVSWVFATKKQKVRLAASRFAAEDVKFEVVPVDSLGCRGKALKN